jgi:isopenicillin N synthase-like dioxygenase
MHNVYKDTSKRRVHLNGDDYARVIVARFVKHRRGYSPLSTENFGCLAGTRVPNDAVEKFRVGPPDCDATGPLQSANSWPVQPETMRVHVEEYYRGMERLADTLLCVFETALQAPQGCLTRCVTARRHTSVLSLNHYPPSTHTFAQTHDQCGERIAAHTDVSVFTIVCQSDGEAGLEVLTRSGEWVCVLPRPGCFVVNVGTRFCPVG